MGGCKLAVRKKKNQTQKASISTRNLLDYENYMQMSRDYALKFFRFSFFFSFIYFQEWVFPNNREVFMTLLFKYVEKESS